jgi:hypothetical protein
MEGDTTEYKHLRCGCGRVMACLGVKTKFLFSFSLEKRQHGSVARPCQSIRNSGDGLHRRIQSCKEPMHPERFLIARLHG